MIRAPFGCLRVGPSIALCVLLLSGCWAPVAGAPPPGGADSADVAFVEPTIDSSAIHGASIVAWRNFLYVIGGIDRGGTCRREVWYSRIGGDGLPGAWARTVDLPEGRAFASCVVAGDFLYLLGGRTAAGIDGSVTFGLIVGDEGSAGYGGIEGFTSGWARNPRPLSAAREGAAAVYYDGRIFLVGGEGPDGFYDLVAHARIWSDGSVGEWYTLSHPLPRAVRGAGAAAFGGRMWVVGGEESEGLSAEVSSAPFEATGLPGAWSPEVAMGVALSYPVVVASADGLVCVGGWTGSPAAGLSRRYLPGQGWVDWGKSTITAFGPHGAIVAGRLYSVTGVNGASAPSVSTVKLDSNAAEPPIVVPGSGYLRSGTRPTVTVLPGDTVRYTQGTIDAPPPDPVETSAVWRSSSPPSVDSERVLKFRSFRAGGAPSDPVAATYLLVSGSMFPLISAVLSPNGTTYRDYTLEVRYSDGSTQSVTALWLKLAIEAAGRFLIRWADAADQQADYSALVRLSLFEGDFCTPVRNREGARVVARGGGGTAQELVTLNAGAYFLLIESTDDRPGGTFGIAVARQ